MGYVQKWTLLFFLSLAKSTFLDMLEKLKSATKEKTEAFRQNVENSTSLSQFREEVEQFKIELDLILSKTEATEPPIQIRNNMDDTGKIR